MIDDNRCYIGHIVAHQWLISGSSMAHQWLISGSSVKKQRRYSSKKLIYKLPN